MAAGNEWTTILVRDLHIAIRDAIEDRDLDSDVDLHYSYSVHHLIANGQVEAEKAFTLQIVASGDGSADQMHGSDSGWEMLTATALVTIAGRVHSHNQAAAVDEINGYIDVVRRRMFAAFGPDIPQTDGITEMYVSGFRTAYPHPQSADWHFVDVQFRFQIRTDQY